MSNPPSSPPPTTSLPPLPCQHPYQTFVPGSYIREANSSTIPSSSRTLVLSHSSREKSQSIYSSRCSFNGAELDRSRRSSTTVKQYFVHHHHRDHPSTDPQGPEQEQQRNFATAPQTKNIRQYQTRISPMPGKADYPGDYLDTPKPLRRRLRKIHPVLWILVFLPISPALCAAYVVIGHVIFQRALGTSAAAAGWSPSLESSAEAAALGGSIIALPASLVLFVLVSLSVSVSGLWRERERGFGLGLNLDVLGDIHHRENSEYASPSIKSQILLFAMYLICSAVFFGVGGAAAPLGVLCLTQSRGRRLGSEDMYMLSLERAAEAGLLGAAVTVVVCLILVLFAFLGRLVCRMNAITSDAEAEKS